MAQHRTAGRQSWILIIIALVILAGVVIGIALTHPGSPSRVKPASSTAGSAQDRPTTPAPSVATSSATSRVSIPSSTIPTDTDTSTPKTINYIVKPGDNLSSIAVQFMLAGYQPLYGWNAKTIGTDPNLIYPGQVLVVAVK